MAQWRVGGHYALPLEEVGCLLLDPTESWKMPMREKNSPSGWIFLLHHLRQQSTAGRVTD